MRSESNRCMRKVPCTLARNPDPAPAGSKRRIGGLGRLAASRGRDCCNAAGKPAVKLQLLLQSAAMSVMRHGASPRGAQQPQVVSNRQEPFNELAQGRFEIRRIRSGTQNGTAANARS